MAISGGSHDHRGPRASVGGQRKRRAPDSPGKVESKGTKSEGKPQPVSNGSNSSPTKPPPTKIRKIESVESVIAKMTDDMERTTQNLSSDLELYQSALQGGVSFILPLLRACQRRLSVKEGIIENSVAKVMCCPPAPQPEPTCEPTVNLSDGVEVVDIDAEEGAVTPVQAAIEPVVLSPKARIVSVDPCELGKDLLNLVMRLKTIEMQAIVGSSHINQLAVDAKNCLDAKRQQYRHLRATYLVQQHALKGYLGGIEDHWGNGDLPCSIIANCNSIPHGLLFESLSSWISSLPTETVSGGLATLQSTLEQHDPQTEHWTDTEIQVIFEGLVMGLNLPSLLDETRQSQKYKKNACPSVTADYVYEHLPEALSEHENKIKKQIDIVEANGKQARTTHQEIGELQKKLKDVQEVWNKLTESIKTIKSELSALTQA